MKHVTPLAQQRRLPINTAGPWRTDGMGLRNRRYMMRTLNPEHMKIIVDLVNKGYYYALLDMDVEELGAGYSRVRVPVS